MTKAWFLTGTDTEIGKTFSACAMLHAFRAQNLSATAYKPVAAGAELIEGRWSNEDARRLHAASSPAPDLAEINPVCLRTPIAPHIAAAEEGVELTSPSLIEGYRRLTQRYDRILVEGVGGFLVPLGRHFGSADLACELALPVILVVGLRLGCLNHAALTAEAVLARGLTLAGWIGNRPSSVPMSRESENIETLRNFLPAPCLGLLPYRDDADPHAAACSLDLTTL